MDKTTAKIFIGIALVVIAAAVFAIFQTSAPQGWVKSVNPDQHISFYHPVSISTQYVEANEWPPEVKVVDGTLDCREQSSGREQTKQIQLGKVTACVSKTIEGAAGSVFTTYLYALPWNNQLATFNFTIRTSQCDNYNSEERSVCLTEQREFNPDELVDKMARTLARED